jgi:hypothetical protein
LLPCCSSCSGLSLCKLLLCSFESRLHAGQATTQSLNLRLECPHLTLLCLHKQQVLFTASRQPFANNPPALQYASVEQHGLLQQEASYPKVKPVYEAQPLGSCAGVGP